MSYMRNSKVEIQMLKWLKKLKKHSAVQSVYHNSWYLTAGKRLSGYVQKMSM